MDQLQERIDQWIKKYGVRYFDERTNALLLVEEVGEFARLIARAYGEQSFKSETSKTEIQNKLKDELADIIFVTCCLANQLGISLTDAMETNLQKKTERDHKRHLGNDKLKR